MSNSYYFRIKLFEPAGTRYIGISKETAVIGQTPDCDLRIKHSSVEPLHLKVWVENAKMWIQDLETSEGTFVNGARIASQKGVTLKNEDVIRLGQSPISLSLEVMRIRPPIVNADAEIDEITATDIKILPLDDIQEDTGTGLDREEQLLQKRHEVAALKWEVQTLRLELKQKINEKTKEPLNRPASISKRTANKGLRATSIAFFTVMVAIAAVVGYLSLGKRSYSTPRQVSSLAKDLNLTAMSEEQRLEFAIELKKMSAERLKLSEHDLDRILTIEKKLSEASVSSKDSLSTEALSGYLAELDRVFLSSEKRDGYLQVRGQMMESNYSLRH